MAAKILLREVKEAHDRWASSHAKWGPDNLDTIRQYGRYQEALNRYRADHGKEPNLGRAR